MVLLGQLLPSSSGRLVRRPGFSASQGLAGTPLLAPRPARLHSRRCRIFTSVLDSSDADQEGQSAPAPEPVDIEAQAREQLQQTMAGLDALLGIEEEPPEEQAPPKAKDLDISISASVVQALADAEAQRSAASSAAAASSPGASGDSADSAQRMRDSLERIAEQARRLAKEDGEGKGDATLGEQAIRSEFENLLTVLAGERGVSAEDVKTIKEKAFGQSSFWVTETRPLSDVEGGILVRGNLRGPREAVFEESCRKLADLFGDKYTLRLVVDVDAEAAGDSSDMRGEPRVAFEVLPTSAATPEPAAGWQRGAAGLLLLLTFASTLQFALTCNIGLLPKETLAWLANPANLNSEVLPPGLESYDALPFLNSAVNVFLATLLPQLAHELAHGIAARVKGIKIGPSFLIPNSQLGTFGSVTQLKSLVRNRTDLFDFASSGLVAGGIISLALFGAGLAASHGGGAAEAGMVPVPAALFQGSLLLGTLSKLVLDPEALTHANVYVSPLLVGGWCGLVTTALNSLPVGNLDGGRAMLSAYGKNTLAVSSLLTYIGLGLGVLGSALALPFGLYVLICQRTSERYIQDEVSGVDDGRRRAAAVIIALAIAVLLPAGVDLSPNDLLTADPSGFL